MSRLLPMAEPDVDPLSIEWMVEVLEKYNHCLEVASERNLSFKMDF